MFSYFQWSVVKPLLPTAFTVVSTHHPHWARVVGYGPLSLCVIHKEGPCPSSEDINRLTMMINGVSISNFL
jgi:hypothetical protein